MDKVLEVIDLKCDILLSESYRIIAVS